jgi:hypothetical protein
MGDNYSNGTTSDTLESLKAERADLEKTIVRVQQMARDFDAETERRKSFDAKRVAFHLQLKNPDLRRCVWKGFTTPKDFQWFKPAIARKKALAEQVIKDAAVLCEALVQWAEDLEKREKDCRARVEQQTVRDPADTSVAATVGLLENQAQQWVAPVVKELGTLGSEIGPEAGLAAEAVVSVPVAAVGIFFASGNTAGWEPDESQSNPQRGWILYDGERRGQDGTIYTSDSQIAVYANGTSALSNEERQAISQDNGEVSEVSNFNPFLFGLRPIPGSRTTGVERAKALEVQLVQATGAGTLDWTPQEVQYILQTGKLPRGIVGHHINNVAIYPNWAGDPRNVQLVRGQSENLLQHAGNYKNPTTGPLIDRDAIIQQKTGGQK